jgi:segregation and condensation protein B
LVVDKGWCQLMILFFKNESMAIIEALLFVAVEPLTIKDISNIVKIDEKTVEELIEQMQQEYQNPNRGMIIEKVAGGYRMLTKPQYVSYIEKLYKPQNMPLSQAALETLAIIAYKCPVTKVEIELIRGVKVDSVLNTLLERNLIKEVGRKDAPGKPILYGTTEKFLEYIGLNDLKDLPQIDGLFEKENS